MGVGFCIICYVGIESYARGHGGQCSSSLAKLTQLQHHTWALLSLQLWKALGPSRDRQTSTPSGRCRDSGDALDTTCPAHPWPALPFDCSTVTWVVPGLTMP